MQLYDKIAKLGERAVELVAHVATEEATKTALVLPFIRELGYDIFDPSEVIPEFTADVGIKRGEKVDYAICRAGEPVILFECKPHGAKLDRYSSQLYRYFSVTRSRIAILTDGIEYRIYSDLVEPNKLDDDPFMVLNLIEPRKATVEQLHSLTKGAFDIDAVLTAADDLRYISKFKRQFASQLESPSDELVRIFVDPVFTGRMTQQVVDRFRPIIKQSLRGHITDTVEARLRSALSQAESQSAAQTKPDIEPEIEAPEVVTTAEELEGLYAVRAILRQHLDPARVVARDVRSYFGILLDDNNRKPICRLWFNGRQKYLGVFDEKKVESRIPITGPIDLFTHADAIVHSAQIYLRDDIA